MNQNPLDLTKSLTKAEFQLYLYKLSIKELNSKLDDFDFYGLTEQSKVIQKVLNEKINNIVTLPE